MTVDLAGHVGSAANFGLCLAGLDVSLKPKASSEFHLFNIQRNPLIGYYDSASYLARLAQRSPLGAKARGVLQSLPANLERPAA